MRDKAIPIVCCAVLAAGFIIGALLFRDQPNGSDQNLLQATQGILDMQRGTDKDLQSLRVLVAQEFIKRELAKTAMLSPSDPKRYSRAESATGTFLVSLERVEPYLNGYRVVLNIGNLSAASYGGFSLRITWNKKIDDETFLTQDSITKWSSTVREKTVRYADRLHAGSWLTVEAVIEPASPESVGHIGVGIITDAVYLLTR